MGVQGTRPTLLGQNFFTFMQFFLKKKKHGQIVGCRPLGDCRPLGNFGSATVRVRSDQASAAASVASLVSKIQMGPRAIPSGIASDATATWSEWHKYKSM